MKKFLTATILSFCIFLAACGGEAPDGQEETLSETKELTIDSSSSSDIFSDAEEIFRFDQEEQKGFFQFLGMQYYQGEPVQLWMEILNADGNSMASPGFIFHSLSGTEDGPFVMEEASANIYLYRTDLSRELLVEGLPANDPHPAFCNFYKEEGAFAANRIYDYTGSSCWYVDRDGCCYCWWNMADGTDGEYTFLKMDAAGNVLYDVLLDKKIRVSNILELPDGATYAVIHDTSQDTTKITEFDPDTGKMSGEEIPIMTVSGKPYSANMSFTFGISEEGTVYTLIWDGIYRLNLSDGTLSEALPFAGTTYTPGDSSIDMTNGGWVTAAALGSEDGSAEILWYNDYLANAGSVGAIGIEERLRPADTDRIPVTIRGSVFSPWLKRQATRFNRTNDTWQIVLEEFDSSNAVDLEEYARLTSVQIATGGGPDMLYGDFMEDYIYGMIEKGALTDLAPLLAEAGVRKEDYLTLVFDVWREDERVYGITPQADACRLYTIEASALDGTGDPDVEALADALLAWEEDASFDVYTNPETVLRWFLQGSDNIWGMVDREGGNCDFSGELFAKLLEVSKRYGSPNARSYHNLIRITPLTDFYQYDSRAELAAAGRAVCGVLFDDGCHGTVTSGYTLAVNASSKSQECALAFLCFLLDEKTQANSSSFPLKRSLLTAWMVQEAARAIASEKGLTISCSPYIEYGEQVKETKTYTAADITQERIMEYLTALEDIRALSSRNAPLLDIICEEAADYFNGTKSAEDTAKVIENRVQLYLDERR